MVVSFSGDKGGLHMKYYVEIVNSLNSGSVDNVHIYSMFEAQDSVENMMKVWFPVYYDQVKANILSKSDSETDVSCMHMHTCTHIHTWPSIRMHAH